MVTPEPGGLGYLNKVLGLRIINAVYSLIQDLAKIALDNTVFSIKKQILRLLIKKLQRVGLWRRGVLWRLFC